MRQSSITPDLGTASAASFARNLLVFGLKSSRCFIVDRAIILGYMRIAAMRFLHLKRSKFSKDLTLFVDCKVLLGISFFSCSHDRVSRHLLFSMNVNTLK